MLRIIQCAFQCSSHCSKDTAATLLYSQLQCREPSFQATWAPYLSFPHLRHRIYYSRGCRFFFIWQEEKHEVSASQVIHSLFHFSLLASSSPRVLGSSFIVSSSLHQHGAQLAISQILPPLPFPPHASVFRWDRKASNTLCALAKW